MEFLQTRQFANARKAFGPLRLGESPTFSEVHLANPQTSQARHCGQGCHAPVVEVVRAEVNLAERRMPRQRCDGSIRDRPSVEAEPFQFRQSSEAGAELL